MPDYILHHYPTSPFSEKVRLIFGAKRLSWKSVIIPRIMPKPDVIALTGGYRKTPILQVGADIYCDSSLIAKKIDESSPSLFPSSQAATVLTLSQWADTVLFGVAVRHVFQPANMAHKFESKSEMEAFSKDRQAMRTNATTRRFSELEAFAIAHAFLKELDRQFGDGVPFVCGASLSVADFSVYHCLWFLQSAPESAKLLGPYHHVLAWMTRMASYGQGVATELLSSDAVQIARSATPHPIKDAVGAGAINIGDAIEVLPTDYGIDPTPGSLVTCAPDEIVIRRIDDRAGEVFVHFPRMNYELRRAST